MNVKTAIDGRSLGNLLESAGFPKFGTSISRMTEGEDSEAFLVKSPTSHFVLRINRAIEGFLKDKLAYERFGRDTLPIPRIIKAGQYNEYAYCLSELAPGFVVQEANNLTLLRISADVDRIHRIIAESDCIGSGFGPLDSIGNAQFETWKEYLLSILPDDQWAESRPDASVMRAARDAFLHLLPKCPERRQLVHGDFGANNLLTNGNEITAVIDWSDALYGDPMYDVAIAYVWSFHLECMRVQREFWEAMYCTEENYRDRILSYQIAILIREIVQADRENRPASATAMSGRLKTTLISSGYF